MRLFFPMLSPALLYSTDQNYAAFMNHSRYLVLIAVEWRGLFALCPVEIHALPFILTLF